MEWKPVLAVTSHEVDPSRAADTLYRMQGSEMDVIATRDHRMLIAQADKQVNISYETVDELLRLPHHPDGERSIVVAGLNTQPAVKVVIPGLERVCEWWWENDEQLSFLSFLGFWLRDGYLDPVSGVVGVGQQKLEGRVAELVEKLLDAVFPRWWSHHFGGEDGVGATNSYIISRCPPLYNYLCLMAVGPIGYNPRDPVELRNYPHFTKDEEVAAKEQHSEYYKSNDTTSDQHCSGTWTVDAMLRALAGGDVYEETKENDLHTVEQDAPSVEALVTTDAGQIHTMQSVGEPLVSDHWFHLKRWLGEQNVASVYSKLSRQQAIALLDGVCRADDHWADIQ